MTPTNTPTSKCEHQEEIAAILAAYKDRWPHVSGLLVGSSLVGNEEGDSTRFWALKKECEKKCHTPTTDSKNSSEDWEKDFDAQFTVQFSNYAWRSIPCIHTHGEAAQVTPESIKSFIRSQIQQAEHRGWRKGMDQANDSDY